MFGKKKTKLLKVVHYNGLQGFPLNYPCILEFQESTLIIKKIKPEMTVTLPIDRIEHCEALDEQSYMLKYHNDKSTTSKFGNKYYLVIKYDKGILTFWGTTSEYGSFIKIQEKYQTSESYSL
jgi:hypothetical protein